MYFWSLISKVKVTYMPISCFTISRFVLNVFFFSSLVVAYVCTFPSEQVFKKGTFEVKNGHILRKDILLKCKFQDKGHLYGNCLFYILSIYYKCLLFQFLRCCIRMHIPILKGVQNGNSGWKTGHILYFAKNCTIWSLISNMKITSIPIACFIFWLLTVKVFFFSSYILAYLCTFPS